MNAGTPIPCAHTLCLAVFFIGAGAVISTFAQPVPASADDGGEASNPPPTAEKAAATV